MNKIFKPRGFIAVPDGTQVSAFLNTTDTSQTDVPWGSLGEMSVAMGQIEAGVHSWVHRHPVVTQVTYLIAGRLAIRMQEPQSDAFYELSLQPREAVLCRPGTCFQLRNDSEQTATVLYLVSPSYVFEMEGDVIIYDDATMVAKSWQELKTKKKEQSVAQLSEYEHKARRTEALRRLALRKGERPRPLASEPITSLPQQCDYLAPDGSEIRLLTEGERGGLAHCVLPKGKISAAVQHRTVEELWYVLSGRGAIWRGREGEASLAPLPLAPGDSVRIPVGVAFQFQAGPEEDLELLLATMPPWPGEEEGPQEAIRTQGYWEKR